MIPRRLQVMIVLLVLAILAMASYLVYLKRKAEAISGAPSGQPISAPLPGPPQQLTLFVASDEDDSLTTTVVSSALPSDAGQRARLALHTLILRYQQKDSPHRLGDGADVHEVYLLDPASAVVNLNAAFADKHQSGVEVEQLSVFSMVRTMKAQLPQLARVRFLVEGKSRVTLAGHVDLSDWIDVGSVVDACRELH
jgi:hypothetical protein